MLLSSASQHYSFHTTAKLSYEGHSLVQETSGPEFAGSLDMSDGLNQTIFYARSFICLRVIKKTLNKFTL